jgi:hypothetical protein
MVLGNIINQVNDAHMSTVSVGWVRNISLGVTKQNFVVLHIKDSQLPSLKNIGRFERVVLI